MANEAKRVEDALRPTMEAVLDAVLSNASQAHFVASLEARIKKRVGIVQATSFSVPVTRARGVALSNKAFSARHHLEARVLPGQARTNAR